MRRVIFIMLCFVSLASVVSGQSGVYGDFHWFVNSGGTVTINQYVGTTDTVSIPSLIEDRSVTHIGDYSFGDSIFKSVDIPSSVVSIGAYAFSYCENLDSITIHEGVANIGGHAFAECYSLQSAFIFSGSIGDSAFYACPSLTSITIGGNVTSIGDSAFEACSSLIVANIPAGVANIGNRAFFDCDNLQNVVIGDHGSADLGFSIIEGAAFANCNGLTNVTIGNSVVSIGAEAFAYCIQLVNITIPDSVTSIGMGAFSSCRSLTNAAIGVNIAVSSRNTSIGGSAFNNCTNLTSVTIGDSVTNIGDSAFSSCGLGSVSIPDSVTSIGASAFYNCTRLLTVTIGNGVKNVGGYAFYWCPLSSITIPDGILSIGEWSFGKCINLTNVTVGSGLTNIGARAFSGCSLLTGVYFRGNAPSIGSYDVFDDYYGKSIVYYLAGTTGWPTVPNPWAGRPTALWGSSSRYLLTVNSGTGGGSYTNGQKVTIKATVPVGWKFDRWNDGNTNALRIITMAAADAVYTASFRDIQNPVLSISSPSNGLRVTNNALVTVVGKATDNSGSVDVLIRLNSGGWTTNNALLRTTNWTATLTLLAGSNSVKVCARDATGNSSMTNTLNLTNAVIGALTIQTNGTGKVIIAPTGAAEVGKTYTLTATAGAGSVFSNWTGDVLNSTNKMTTFVMTSNMTIRANFTDIQKPTVVIKTPTALQKVFGTNGNFAVTGTALDNLALSNVMVSVNGASAVPASTTTNVWKNWSLPVTLTDSNNTIAAYSVDTTGHHSTTVTVKCVYTETGALNIRTNGPGKVTVAPTGPLLLGKTYTLTAAAGIGGIFSNWIGDATSTSNKIAVTLNATNKIVSVTANFTDIAKPTVVITYPANKAKVLTNGLVIVRGTATDNDVLKEVKYQLYDGSWTNAASTNNLFKNWTAPYVPVAGLNTSLVYSVDMQNNHSMTQKVVFTYIPGAVLTVETNGNGTITPSLNGKVLQIGTTNTMTAAPKAGSTFVDWTAGIGESQVTTGKVVKFVMTTNLVLTANFHLMFKDPVADVLAAPQAIVVDGSSKDWTGIPCSSFSYASVTQEVAVALSGNNIALLLSGCPFSTSDTVLVYFKLRLTYGTADDRHTVDLWTSGSVLYGMVDGQVITGLEAVLLNGVLEVKIPVEQAPSQVTIEEVGCGMDIGSGTMTELFKFNP